MPFRNKKICVIGCGGTGCEILKIIYRFTRNIVIIDNDRIEITNLNRQFFYSEDDCGEFKSKVLGEKLQLEFKTNKIEELDSIFLESFDLIFLCVDNIKTRMNVNFIVKRSNKNSILIDLGVEGLKCHVKKITKETSCLYCIKDLFIQEQTIPLCTLSNVKEVTEENRERFLRSVAFEYDEIDEAMAIFNKKVNNIELITNKDEIAEYKRNIVPNVAYVNSICASLAIKLLFDDENCFYFYDASKTIYLVKEKIEKDENCIVCNMK